MCLLVYFLLLPISINEGAKPRSVNVALETVFEFGNETDITIVESVQDFLSKIKGALEYSYRRHEQPRRFNSLLVTEFIEDSIKILKSYNDLDLAYFIELLDTELNEHDYRHCEGKITKEISLRKFIAEKLSDARSSPIEKIRRNLDDILDELKNKRDNRRQIYGFLNSLLKRHSQERFRSILDNLQLYRRRQMDPTMTLRAVVQDSIRSLINDYICNLNYSHAKKLRNIFKTIHEDEVSLSKLKGYSSNRNNKKAMEENDMYEATVINRGDNQKYKKIEPQNNDYSEDNNEEILEKEKSNASLTNSEDILDLKIDDGDSPDYETELNKPEDLNDATLYTFKTKSKKKRRPYLKKKTSISNNDVSTRSYSESKEDQSNFFDYTIVPTIKQRKASKKKRLKTFVTLYPEIITHLTRSVKKKKRTDNIRKKFNKLSSEEQKEIIKGINIEREDSKTEEVSKKHETNLKVGMDKSTATPKVQYSDRKRFKIKSNLSTLKSTRTDKNNETPYETEENSKDISNEPSGSKYNEVEHFGSLYKQKNNKTAKNIYRGYRKSNNLVTTGTKEIENKTTRTFGTLSFWRRTETTVKSTNEDMFSKKNSPSKVYDSITNATKNNNQSTSSLKANDKMSVQNQTIIIKNNTNVSVSNSASMKTTKTVEMLKKTDLRRLLDNTILNEINDDSHRKMSQRFQEDLNKVFFTPPKQTPKSLKENADPIDEIEAAFNLR